MLHWIVYWGLLKNATSSNKWTCNAQTIVHYTHAQMETMDDRPPPTLRTCSFSGMMNILNVTQNPKVHWRLVQGMEDLWGMGINFPMPPITAWGRAETAWLQGCHSCSGLYFQVISLTIYLKENVVCYRKDNPGGMQFLPSPSAMPCLYMYSGFRFKDRAHALRDNKKASFPGGLNFRWHQSAGKQSIVFSDSCSRKIPRFQQLFIPSKWPGRKQNHVFAL